MSTELNQVTWTEMEVPDVIIDASVLAAMNDANLHAALRGRTLDEVIEAWREVNDEARCKEPRQ